MKPEYATADHFTETKKPGREGLTSIRRFSLYVFFKKRLPLKKPTPEIKNRNHRIDEPRNWRACPKMNIFLFDLHKKNRNKNYLRLTRWSGLFCSCPDYVMFVLCYILLCCVMYVMLCYAMLCYAMLCYAMLCYAILCYVCYVMLCCVLLCYPMLCYVMFCYVMLSYVMLCMLCYVCYVMLCYLILHLTCLCFAMLCMFYSVLFSSHLDLLEALSLHCF